MRGESRRWLGGAERDPGDGAGESDETHNIEDESRAGVSGFEPVP